MVCAFSIATSFTTDPQGIADNTVTTVIAYLLGLAALLLAARVYFGFERTPVDRPVKRWVMVPTDSLPNVEASDVAATNRRFLLSPDGANRQHSLMDSADGALGGHPFVVAHRGASADRPEHTIAAYELALREGADARRVRRAAHPRRPPGVRARPQGGPHVNGNRTGERHDAG